MNLHGRTETDHEPPPPYGGAQGAAHQFARDLEKARYEAKNEVGAGGMGRVILAREVPLRRQVAMKLLREDRQSEAMEARLIREARITGILEHPSIGPVHDLGKNERGEIFFTMKKVEGLTLAEIIEKLKPASGEATPEDKAARADIKTRFGSLVARLEIIQKVCDAISFAHAHELRVIHRDLKPENIMVGRFGEVLVMDWGLAKVLGNQALLGDLPAEDVLPDVALPAVMELTQMGSFLGSWLYAPPEQIEGRLDDIDERSDVYALGCVLYQLLSLDSPLPLNEESSATKASNTVADARAFVLSQITAHRTAPLLRGTQAQKEEHGIPQALAALILPALEPEPTKRIQSVSAIKQAIGQHLSGFAHDFENAGAWAHFRYFVKRHKAVSVATSVGALAIMIAGWALVVEKSKRDQMLLVASRVNHAQALDANIGNRHAECLALLSQALIYRPTNFIALGASAAHGFGLNSSPWIARTVIPFNNGVCCVAFSPDGHYSAVGGGDGKLKLIDTATSKVLYVKEYTGLVSDVSFSSDGRYIAAGSWDGSVQVFEVSTGKEVHSRGFPERVISVSFNPRDNSMAVVTGNTVTLVDASTGETIKSRSFEQYIHRLEFSGDGQHILIGVAKAAHILDAKEGQEMGKTIFDEEVESLAFAPDGTHFLAGVADGSVSKIKLATFKADKVAELSDRITAIRYSPDGLLFAVGEGKNVHIFDEETIEEIATVEFEGFLTEIAFSPDGQLLLAASQDHTARLITIQTGKELAKFEFGDQVTVISFSADGRYFVAGSDDKTARMFESAPNSERNLFNLGGFITASSLSFDGQYLAASVENGTTRIIAVETGKEICNVVFDHGVSELRFSPNGRLFVAGVGAGVCVVEVDTGKTVFMLESVGRLSATSFSPDSSQVCVGGSDGSVQIINLVSRKALNLAKFSNRITKVDFSPNQQSIVASSHDGTFRIIDVANAKEINRTARTGLDRQILSVTHSPNGHQIAIAGGTDAKIVNAKTGECFWNVRFGGWVTLMNFSPNGLYVLAASHDKTVRSFEVASGTEISRTEFDDSADMLSYSPDGRLFAAGVGKKVHIVVAETGEEVATIDLDERAVTIGFTADGTGLIVLSWSGSGRVFDSTWFYPQEEATRYWQEAMAIQSGRSIKANGRLCLLSAEQLNDAQGHVLQNTELNNSTESRWQRAILKWVQNPPAQRTTSPWTLESSWSAVGRWLMTIEADLSAISDCASRAPWHPLEPISLARPEPSYKQGPNSLSPELTVVRARFLARLTLKRLKDADEKLYGRDTLAQYAEWSAKIMHEELLLHAETLEAIDFAIERTPKEKQQPLLDLKSQLK